jgi:hypothetical protein
MPGEYVIGTADMLTGGTSRRGQRMNQNALASASKALSAVLRATYEGEEPARVLAKAGIRVVNRVRQLSHQRGSGITRRSAVSRAMHTASAPGQPFATDSGRLSASYNWQLGGTGGADVWVDIGTNVEYGPYLEFGTSRMAPRPTLRPAIELERDRIAEENRDMLAARLSAEVHMRGGR